MHPAIIIGIVRSLIVDVAMGRYHVPQNVFLVLYRFFPVITACPNEGQCTNFTFTFRCSVFLMAYEV